MKNMMLGSLFYYNYSVHVLNVTCKYTVPLAVE